jgi:hypothetical protein
MRAPRLFQLTTTAEPLVKQSLTPHRSGADAAVPGVAETRIEPEKEQPQQLGAGRTALMPELTV